MKRIIYITISTLLLLSGCSKPSPAPAPAPEHFSKYIFFSHSVETKASLVEGAGDIGTFGVVGFKYDGNWRDYDIKDVDDIDGDGNKDEVIGNTLEPNVFYEDDNSPVKGGVETVNVTSVDGTRNENEATIGTASYTPLQGWSNSKKYTFFAFYPVENSAVSLVNQDGEPYSGGVPAVKYTMDNTTADSFKNSMVDLMTAPAKTDLFWYGSAEGQNNITGGEIPFNFQHRLSALGVNVKYSTSGSILLKGITLRLSGIKYNTVRIPLDGATATRAGSSFSMDIPITLAEDEGALDGSGAKELADKLILIPQTELIIQVLVSYKRVVSDYSDSIVEDLRVLTQQLELKEASKHMINLNFTEKSVSATASSSSWVTQLPVYDTFN